MAHLVACRADYPQFSAGRSTSSGSPGRARPGGGAAIREYLGPVIAARPADPGDDVISKLVTGTVDGNSPPTRRSWAFRLLMPPGRTTFADRQR
jgi:hypothetical protein